MTEDQSANTLRLLRRNELNVFYTAAGWDFHERGVRT